MVFAEHFTHPICDGATFDGLGALPALGEIELGIAPRAELTFVLTPMFP
jgi:hypothetical protein